MSGLNAALTQFLKERNIRNSTVLLGVSGGADSVALLRGMLAVAPEFQLVLRVAHFDHALRPDSAEDARWVRELCDRYEIPCVIERANWLGKWAARSSEEFARKKRYEFLHRTALREECRWIAVAHTRNDQVETILHHLIRGSGLKGLTGIPETRVLARRLPQDVSELDSFSTSCVKLFRPLLSVSRDEILSFLYSIGQQFRTDCTNERNQFTRNRIRNEVLPMLRAQVNRQVDEALLRLAQQAQETQEAFRQLAGESLSACLFRVHPDLVRLRPEILAGRPVAFLREIFVQLWEMQGWPRKDLSFAHLDRLARAVQTGKPFRLSLPGKIEAANRLGILEFRRPSSGADAGLIFDSGLPE